MNTPIINLRGPEGKNITGEFAEDEIEAFFSNFAGWNSIYYNVDIAVPKVSDEEKSENRGYDFIYELFEPLENINQGVIIESKKISDISNFTPSMLAKHIGILKHKVKQVMNYQELYEDTKIKACNVKSFRYAILCYRFSSFDYDKYLQTLEMCKLEETIRDMNFPTIFILSNDRLKAFVELKNYTKDLKFYSRQLRSTNTLQESDKLPLFHLFSDIVPFKSKDGDGILTFDKPSVESFLFIKDFESYYNMNLSTIIFANCNYNDEPIYNQYKSEIEGFENISPMYLGFDMNCSINLKTVFK